MESRRVNFGAVRGRREGAGRVGKEGNYCERIASERFAEIIRIEDPYIGASDARFCQFLRIVFGILAPVSDRNEDTGTIAVRPGKDNVPRLIANQQSSYDARDMTRTKIDNG